MPVIDTLFHAALALNATFNATLNWTAPVGSSFVYAINDPLLPSVLQSTSGVNITAHILDVDLFDTNASTIASYKVAGHSVLCYFSAGSFEDWRPDTANFDPACYCNKSDSCALQGWAGEWWFDLSTPVCVQNIEQGMTKRIQLAKSKGCDAVDPDNIDSYENDTGYNTTADDQLAYMQFLSETARNNSLGITMKNGGDLLAARQADVLPLFDAAIIEQCIAYDECGLYEPFIAANKSAFGIEYGTTLNCQSNNTGFVMLEYGKSQSLTYKNVLATQQCYNTTEPSS